MLGYSMQEVLVGGSNCHPHRCALIVRIEGISNCHHQHGFGDSLDCFFGLLVLFLLGIGALPMALGIRCIALWILLLAALS